MEDQGIKFEKKQVFILSESLKRDKQISQCERHYHQQKVNRVIRKHE